MTGGLSYARSVGRIAARGDCETQRLRSPNKEPISGPPVSARAGRLRSSDPPTPSRRPPGASPAAPGRRADRRSLSYRVRSRARGRTHALRREDARQGWTPPASDERRHAHLDAGVSDGRDVRRATRYPGVPLPRQAPPRGHPLSSCRACGRRRGGARRGPRRHPSRRQRLRVRVHRQCRERPLQLRQADTAERPRCRPRAVRVRRARLGRAEGHLPDHGCAAPVPGALPGASAGREQTLAMDEDQGRRLGVGAPVLHGGGRARSVRRCSCHLRELPRPRRRRPCVRTPGPRGLPRARVRGPLDPSDRSGLAARPRAPVRPLRPVRSRPGAVEAVRRADGRQPRSSACSSTSSWIPPTSSDIRLRRTGQPGSPMASRPTTSGGRGWAGAS